MTIRYASVICIGNLPSVREIKTRTGMSAKMAYPTRVVGSHFVIGFNYPFSF
jgi:hypothetical protein